MDVTTAYSVPDDGRKGLQDLFHSNSRQKPVADTTVYSVPDDGRKGHPKHVQLLTPNKEHKKSFISLAFI